MGPRFAGRRHCTESTSRRPVPLESGDVGAPGGERAATDLVGWLALYLLDDGDAAGLDALIERHAAVRGTMPAVVRAVLGLERAPTEASMLAVYRAFAAWVKPWAARLDEDGKAPARRADRSDD